MADPNKIANVEKLIRLRVRGNRPPLQFITYGNGGRLHGCDVGISDEASPELIDLRPFVGLDVLVIADRYTPKLMRLCERLNEYAATTALSVIDWLPDDLGLIWQKGSRTARAFGTEPEQQEV